MKLTLDVPHAWTSTTTRGWTTHLSPDRTLRVIVPPLIERTNADIRRVIAHDLPAGARVDDVAATPTRRANAGWEVSTATARVVSADGELVEHRRVAVYHVLWMLGAVIVVGTDLERDRELIDALLASGRPHLWDDEPASVREWFELEPA